jgi:hypothetical protein
MSIHIFILNSCINRALGHEGHGPFQVRWLPWMVLGYDMNLLQSLITHTVWLKHHFVTQVVMDKT